MFYLLVLMLCPTVYMQLNLYDTDRNKIGNEQLQFDCLHYDIFTGVSSFIWVDERTSQTIKYCRRPLNVTNIMPLDFLEPPEENFTFKQLRGSNITVNQLLAWSAPVDLAERYLLYTEQPIIDGPSSDEVFYKCTNRWFGSRCQYLFEFTRANILQDVVASLNLEKDWFAETAIDRMKNPSCYAHLKCDRGIRVCLDWREVCNGQIDCIDGGADEANCFELEINECADDEYRCHNGLCIPADFYKDDQEHPDCLDLSDEPTSILPFDFCYRDPGFRCEETVCRSDLNSFPCGDGQCINGFNDSCVNGRNILLELVMLEKGSLSDDCWLFIVCHTIAVAEIDESLCANLFALSSIDNSNLSTCESFFQFPTIPVLYGHVRFLYDNNQSRLMQDDTIFLLPDYICYDEHLCDFIPPTFHYQNLTCRHRRKLLDTDLSYNNFLIFLKNYFRHCATPYMVTNGEQYRQHQSIYCCKNSSKCISKHRLKDRVIDCYMGDDEEYDLSCSLTDKYRFKCSDQDKTCWSSSVDPNSCSISNQKQSLSEILFQNICDGVVNLLPQEIDGRIHSDETECQYWQCSNIYTRCDSFKACSDGRDEYGCLKAGCPSTFHPCISPVNCTVICLPMDQVADNIIDCLGATDELQLCHISQGEDSFHCWNATQCILPSKLWEYFDRCPLYNDDEFCESNSEICCRSASSVRRAKSIVLQLFEIQSTVNLFSLETARVYPQLETTIPILKMNQSRTNKQTVVQSIRSADSDIESIWRCHRGLDVVIWLGGQELIGECFCPPTYYGELCEYQNERVSLTLRLLPVSRRSLYAFVVLLIDGNGQINSHEQFIFSTAWGCSKKFNIYLLYSTRPKDPSKNYSIHIDAFDKYTMTYHASWHLPIPFIFLPVNRIAANLIIPFRSAQILKTCNLTCNNGGWCMKYVNAEKFFCRCHSSWTGSYCDIPVDCNDCSNDSICVGSFNNRTICVCPENKIGPRCLIPSVCPPDACKNNGQCVLLQSDVEAYRYFCICPDPFYGSQCDIQKSKLEIVFSNVEIPSHILVYIITKQTAWSTTVSIRKLIHNQHIATFYSVESIHMVFVKFSANYYLAVAQKSPKEYEYISTPITPSQRCLPINELFNLSVSTLPRIQRVKYYQLPCQTRSDLWCFFDEIYMCLCTLENHANCFEFNHDITFACRHDDFCENDASCFQDDITCPSSTICICTDCYFGTRCQFYAKGFGLTLDDILRYEIRPNATLSQQSISVKASAAVTMFMFILGLANGVLSFLTFRRKPSQQVGCGLYLFASSITSILIMTIFAVKFWFLILSQIDFFVNRTVLQLGCQFIEYFLKFSIYTDNWLNGCVAIERACAVFIGVTFNKIKSKRIAKWTIFILPILVMVTIIHEPLYRGLYDDEEEQRTWCVTHYSRLLQNYNSTIILIHFLTPFIINLFSAFFIITMTARQRNASQSRLTYQQHLCNQFVEHKQILISPIALVILSLPRLIISLLITCIKSSRNPWLYLVGYFISFGPSMLMFVIFVLPSDLYNKQFKESIKICKQCLRR